jgi:hypothetical protein
MRRFNFVVASLLFAVSTLFAQTPPPARAPDPSPPPMIPVEDSEPEITIKQREGATVQEYRMNGRLYKVVVTPDNAPPYTLIDPRGDGVFVGPESPGTPQLSVPMWVIGTF